MRETFAAVALCATLALPGVASAARIVGSYEGVINGGYASGGFGYAATTYLAGQTVRGTFEYDTDDFGTVCSLTAWSACYLGTGLTITQTVNGVTETFVSTLPAAPGAGNNVHGGLALYNLDADTIELSTYGYVGSLDAKARNYWTDVSTVLPTGTIADVLDRYTVYDGPSGLGASGGLPTGFIQPNRTKIAELTKGDLTMDVDFTFDINRFSIGPAAVPEPRTWALMLVGFGLVGAAVRARRVGGVARGNPVG
ncbi:MAG: PEPxxWA-CTERM sorting domain-containing protein [Alphaproteobacteria bacterium]|nr:PEPxxWA-CTERM sorting domain-containing protein [Alphaproteobacteria bacterium]MBU1512708.1 PEPxxWA-CTERM sorting domain-containing protein [Alphaproteobacteria bacterium]MBU2096087.1 PEPxxWA-CTERM sorting domain-containing protein [Alphaproteobacteria bacterium]MBU2152443.1 PEPxxWA-CTERM sorting domain-containing protein [Alphaproteobacteria bacterium]MBU2308023.1 PEPxxWA-CTERM sorting domain-containing protein [Alphaproteobacteria bacterium]